MGYGGSNIPRPLSIGEYIDKKIEMLSSDFFISLDYEEERHIRSLKTERAVDQYARDILVKKL